MQTISKTKSVSVKRKVAKLLKELPESSSIEDIQYHLYVMQKIDKGLDEAKSRKGYTTAELEKKLGKWIRK